MKRLIIFLIRRRLGLKKYEQFRFMNQKTKDVYYFTNTELIKMECGMCHRSGVSLNWLLNDNCEITKEIFR